MTFGDQAASTMRSLHLTLLLKNLSRYNILFAGCLWRDAQESKRARQHLMLLAPLTWSVSVMVDIKIRSLLVLTLCHKRTGICISGAAVHHEGLTVKNHRVCNICSLCMCVCTAASTRAHASRYQRRALCISLYHFSPLFHSDMVHHWTCSFLPPSRLDRRANPSELPVCIDSNPAIYQ